VVVDNDLKLSYQKLIMTQQRVSNTYGKQGTLRLKKAVTVTATTFLLAATGCANHVRNQVPIVEPPIPARIAEPEPTEPEVGIDREFEGDIRDYMDICASGNQNRTSCLLSAVSSSCGVSPDRQECVSRYIGLEEEPGNRSFSVSVSSISQNIFSVLVGNDPSDMMMYELVYSGYVEGESQEPPNTELTLMATHVNFGSSPDESRRDSTGLILFSCHGDGRITSTVIFDAPEGVTDGLQFLETELGIGITSVTSDGNGVAVDFTTDNPRVMPRLR